MRVGIVSIARIQRQKKMIEPDQGSGIAFGQIDGQPAFAGAGQSVDSQNKALLPAERFIDKSGQISDLPCRP